MPPDSAAAADDGYIVLVPAGQVMESKLGIPFVLKDLLSVKFNKAKIKALLTDGQLTT